MCLTWFAETVNRIRTRDVIDRRGILLTEADYDCRSKSFPQRGGVAACLALFLALLATISLVYELVRPIDNVRFTVEQAEETLPGAGPSKKLSGGQEYLYGEGSVPSLSSAPCDSSDQDLGISNRVYESQADSHFVNVTLVVQAAASTQVDEKTVSPVSERSAILMIGSTLLGLAVFVGKNRNRLKG